MFSIGKVKSSHNSAQAQHLYESYFLLLKKSRFVWNLCTLYDGPCPNLLRGGMGPNLCPLWFLVGTPSAIRPELASRRAEHSLPYSDVAKYIFDILYLLPLLFVYWFLLPLRLVWLLVCCLYKEVYIKNIMRVLLITWLLRGVGRWARKPVNNTSWVAVVTPTDRPKSVRNRCVIELFCGVVCVVTLPFWHFC